MKLSGDLLISLNGHFSLSIIEDLSSACLLEIAESCGETGT